MGELAVLLLYAIMNHGVGADPFTLASRLMEIATALIGSCPTAILLVRFGFPVKCF